MVLGSVLMMSQEFLIQYWFKLKSKGSTWIKLVQNGSNLFIMDQIDSKWINRFKMDHNSTKWIRLAQNRTYWFKKDLVDSNWIKFVQFFLSFLSGTHRTFLSHVYVPHESQPCNLFDLCLWYPFCDHAKMGKWSQHMYITRLKRFSVS